MRWKALVAVMLLTSGCYRWAPISSLNDIVDDKVRITKDDDVVVLEHANVRGRIVTGTRAHPPFDAVGPPDTEVDVTSSEVQAWRLNVGVAIGVSAGVTLTVAALIVAAVFALMRHPVFEEGDTGR
jgi:hypothetical protein